MTDDNAQGSTGDGQQSQQQSQGNQQGDGQQQSASFLDSLPDDIKTDANLADFAGKKPEDLARSYIDLRKKTGADPSKLIRLPTDEKDVEGLKAMRTALGVPETPDGYKLEGLKVPETWNQDVLKGAKGKLHELGLSDKQAAGVLSFYQGYEAETIKGAEANFAAEDAKNLQALKTEFGAAYDAKMADATLAANKLFGKEGRAALKAMGAETNPVIIKALSNAAAMFKEHGSHGGDAPAAGALTPTEAKAQINKMMTDTVEGPILRDSRHPRHKELIEKKDRLYSFAYPQS